MKYTFILSLLLLFTTILDASYARSIRLSSYLNEVDAQKALKELEIFIENNNRLQQFKRETNFDVLTIKSGKYYMHVLRPFTNKKMVQETLDILRTKYSYVYPKKIKYHSSYENFHEVKVKPLINRSELIKKIDSLIQDDNSDIREKTTTYSNQKIIKNSDKIRNYPELPLSLPTLKYTYLSSNSDIKPKNDKVISDTSNIVLTVFKNYMLEMIVFAVVIIFLLLLLIFYKFRKNRENKISIQEIYT